MASLPPYERNHNLNKKRNNKIKEKRRESGKKKEFVKRIGKKMK